MKNYQAQLLFLYSHLIPLPLRLSRNRLLRTILRERQDLRERIDSGELKADFPKSGDMAHTIIIGDEVFKGPLARGFSHLFNKEAALLKKIEGRGLLVPQITYTGKKANFFGMSRLPGVELYTVFSKMNNDEKAALANDIVDFIIGMANSAPKGKRFPHHVDLHQGNVLVDPDTRKLTGIIDFGIINNKSKKSLGRTKLKFKYDTSLRRMVESEYARRINEIPDPASLKQRVVGRLRRHSP